jgi:hypothetical protein
MATHIAEFAMSTHSLQTAVASPKSETNSRLQVRPNRGDYVAIVDGHLIYILIDKRDEFDRIALPVVDNGENENGHVLSKSIDRAGIYIVFQHWLKERTIEAIREDNEKRRAKSGDVVS